MNIKQNLIYTAGYMETYGTTKKLSSQIVEKRNLIIQEIHKFNHVGLTLS